MLGSGPDSGVGVASYFAARNFGRIAMRYRNAETVKTYPVNVGDAAASVKALKQVETDRGLPAEIFHNAS